jgi:hypothetical protein
VISSTTGHLPFQVIVVANRITASIESSKAPFQWLVVFQICTFTGQ